LLPNFVVYERQAHFWAKSALKTAFKVSANGHIYAPLGHTAVLGVVGAER
jgi:hypothetical protein